MTIDEGGDNQYHPDFGPVKTPRERMLAIEIDLRYIRRDLNAIRWWVRWLTGTVGLAVVTALVNFALGGGLLHP